MTETCRDWKISGIKTKKCYAAESAALYYCVSKAENNEVITLLAVDEGNLSDCRSSFLGGAPQNRAQLCTDRTGSLFV